MATENDDRCDRCDRCGEPLRKDSSLGVCDCSEEETEEQDRILLDMFQEAGEAMMKEPRIKSGSVLAECRPLPLPSPEEIEDKEWKKNGFLK